MEKNMDDEMESGSCRGCFISVLESRQGWKRSPSYGV